MSRRLTTLAVLAALVGSATAATPGAGDQGAMRTLVETGGRVSVDLVAARTFTDPKIVYRGAGDLYLYEGPRSLWASRPEVGAARTREAAVDRVHYARRSREAGFTLDRRSGLSPAVINVQGGVVMPRVGAGNPITGAVMARFGDTPLNRTGGGTSRHGTATARANPAGVLLLQPEEALSDPVSSGDVLANPVPGAAALMLTALGGAAAWRRKRA